MIPLWASWPSSSLPTPPRPRCRPRSCTPGQGSSVVKPRETVRVKINQELIDTFLSEYNVSKHSVAESLSGRAAERYMCQPGTTEVSRSENPLHSELMCCSASHSKNVGSSSGVRCVYSVLYEHCTSVGSAPLGIRGSKYIKLFI